MWWLQHISAQFDITVHLQQRRLCPLLKCTDEFLSIVDPVRLSVCIDSSS